MWKHFLAEVFSKHKKFHYRRVFWKKSIFEQPIMKNHFLNYHHLFNSVSIHGIQLETPKTQVFWLDLQRIRGRWKRDKVKNLQKMKYLWTLAWKYFFTGNSKIWRTIHILKLNLEESSEIKKQMNKSHQQDWLGLPQIWTKMKCDWKSSCLGPWI